MPRTKCRAAQDGVLACSLVSSVVCEMQDASAIDVPLGKISNGSRHVTFESKALVKVRDPEGHESPRYNRSSLLSGTMTLPSSPPEHPNTRITVGNHFADIVINREGLHPIYYWIVQRTGSADVVAWGQEESFSKAEESAQHWLTSLRSDQH